jgi:LmbE family N-acetylglucosaminyl deacetylase
MKITPPDHASVNPSAKAATNRPQQETGPSFGQVLNQAVEQQPGRACESANAMAIHRPPALGASPQSQPHQASAAQVEASLDAIEAYCGALRDPQATLREMVPLMASLEAAQEALDETLSDLPREDPLRQIGDQTRSLIVAEKARFTSGIYT